MDNLSFSDKLRYKLFGPPRNIKDPHIFHKISLIAFLAWIGLGSDGISSSCYGPSESFIALGGHHYLSPILAIMIAATVIIISISYAQIIELFPSGGGGYLVASKLLSPATGMVSGCALLVDYVLTITVSIASGTDAVFSFLPLSWQIYKIPVAISAVIVLIIMNSRGVKESVEPLVPIFLVFLLTHAILIVYAFLSHITDLPAITTNTMVDFRTSVSQIGLSGVLILLFHSYSLGSGTYTGIEAISNGLPILREPKVKTGKTTMIYMAISLAFMAGGLIFAYLFYSVEPITGKTLNAVLFEKITSTWAGGTIFVITTLISEALILFVAAQTGFLDGPRVLSNMALDNWMPARFSLLSDRLVTSNGIMLMGISSIILMWFSKGSVSFLLVLYSINVFLTFSLSQLGMVKHWWQARKKESGWLGKIGINGIGLILTSFILITVIVVKFNEGGWLTVIITGTLVCLSLLIKKHYNTVRRQLKRLDTLLDAGTPPKVEKSDIGTPEDMKISSNTNTAVILVNGFNGVGLHTLFSVIRNFKNHFKYFIFLQVGNVDAGSFKGKDEIENFKQNIIQGLSKYKGLMISSGYYAEYVFSMGTDVIDEVEKNALQISNRFPKTVFFSGQLVFKDESIFTRFLHNYTSFAIQKRLYYHGIPVSIMPIRINL